MLLDRLGIPERRASRYVGQRRSSQLREPLIAEDDAALSAALRAFGGGRGGGISERIGFCSMRAGDIDRERVQRP
jgi:hypothetical protein